VKQHQIALGACTVADASVMLGTQYMEALTATASKASLNMTNQAAVGEQIISHLMHGVQKQAQHQLKIPHAQIRGNLECQFHLMITIPMVISSAVYHGAMRCIATILEQRASRIQVELIAMLVNSAVIVYRSTGSTVFGLSKVERFARTEIRIPHQLRESGEGECPYIYIVLSVESKVRAWRVK